MELLPPPPPFFNSLQHGVERRMKLQLRFELGQRVRLIDSGERGIVTGRAEYLKSEPSYLIRYKAADGRQVTGWWEESAIESVDATAATAAAA